MPFEKGNKLWQKSLETKKENKQKIELFIATLANGGMDRYAEIMDSLADGYALEKYEEQYLDRVDGWREYVLPKLARAEVVGDKDKPLEVNLNLSPEQLTTIAAAASRVSGNARSK